MTSRHEGLTVCETRVIILDGFIGRAVGKDSLPICLLTVAKANGVAKQLRKYDPQLCS